MSKPAGGIHKSFVDCLLVETPTGQGDVRPIGGQRRSEGPEVV